MRQLHSHATLLFCGLAALALPATATATPCDATIVATSNVVLTENLVQTAFATTQNCLELRNGADLDLNGFSIVCQASMSGPTCNTAVVATHSGSIVRDTGGGGGIIGEPDGLWNVAVDEAQEVRDTLIDFAVTGVTGDSFVKKVRNNVFYDVEVCVDVTLNSNTSFVRDNYCRPDLDNSAFVGIYDRVGLSVHGTSGGAGPRVDYNLVVGADRGIESGGGKLRVEDNIVLEPDDNAIYSIYLQSGQTADGNICSMIAYDTSPACTWPEAPFMLP